MQHLSNPSVPKNHVKHRAQNILTINHKYKNQVSNAPNFLSQLSVLSMSSASPGQMVRNTYSIQVSEACVFLIQSRCTYPFKTKSIFFHLHLLLFWKLITVHTLVGQCFVQFSLFFCTTCCTRGGRNVQKSLDIFTKSLGYFSQLWCITFNLDFVFFYEQ